MTWFFVLLLLLMMALIASQTFVMSFLFSSKIFWHDIVYIFHMNIVKQWFLQCLNFFCKGIFLNVFGFGKLFICFIFLVSWICQIYCYPWFLFIRCLLGYFLKGHCLLRRSSSIVLRKSLFFLFLKSIVSDN